MSAYEINQEIIIIFYRGNLGVSRA